MIEVQEIETFAKRFQLTKTLQVLEKPNISYKEIFEKAFQDIGSVSLLFDIIMKSGIHRLIYQFAVSFEIDEARMKRVVIFFSRNLEDSLWLTILIKEKSNSMSEDLLDTALDYAVLRKDLVIMYDIARYTDNLNPDQKRRLVVAMSQKVDDVSWETAIFRDVSWLTEEDKKFFWNQTE
ncbi:MAG: hypothetical protein WD471_02070 [Candidatus Paceibacterota bacterium]